MDAASPASKKRLLRDSKLKGFGLQVMPSGAKTFIVQYRTHEGRFRRMSLGRNGELTPDQARDLATDVLAKVRNGDDPLLERENKRPAPIVNHLLDTYMSKHVQVHNMPKTMNVS
ncbi:Phage integrase [Pseudovibrio sp. FO-BEG1]|nr:Phage integrase family protein [Pseudovibrio sp. FO-BEG1]AEV37871.1 Phage integrase [Pseudovibrio sp. FO-BEG1]